MAARVVSHRPGDVDLHSEPPTAKDGVGNGQRAESAKDEDGTRLPSDDAIVPLERWTHAMPGGP